MFFNKSEKVYTEQRFEHNVVMITSQKTSLLMDNWFSCVISFYFLDSILLNLLSPTERSTNHVNSLFAEDNVDIYICQKRLHLVNLCINL